MYRLGVFFTEVDEKGNVVRDLADVTLGSITPAKELYASLGVEWAGRDFASLVLSGREDLNLRPAGPETAWAPSQTVRILRKSARRLPTERVGQSSRPSHSQRKPKVLLPICYPTPAGPAAQRASGGERRAPIASVAPTLADLRVLWGGRDRPLRVAEVAEHLGVCNASVYRLCERGELPHVWIVNSIRIRPSDLGAFLSARLES